MVEQVLTLAAERSRLQPNIDAALGALGHVAGLDHDAGEALFGIARMAGWIAHALEEYQERPLRFRPAPATSVRHRRTMRTRPDAARTEPAGSAQPRCTRSAYSACSSMYCATYQQAGTTARPRARASSST